MDLPTEKHPFLTYIPKKCNYLLIGSFPPIKLTQKLEHNIEKLELKSIYTSYSNNKRNIISDDDFPFYYGSRDNLFWKKIIVPIFEIEIDSVDSMKTFLNKYKIGVTDISEEISRKINSNRKISSSDQDLKIHSNRNLEQIINTNDINLIFCTSKWVLERVKSQQYSWNKKISLVTLPSPSKSANRSIGRMPEYKSMKKNNEIKDTIEYRQKKYIELLKKKLL
jgi:hypothetical protein